MTNPLKWLTQVSASKPATFEEGLDAYSQKITNVAAGAASTDAINYGQLTDQSGSLKSYIDAADTTIENNINSASSSLKSYVDAADSALQTNINNASSSIVSYVDAADSAFQGNLDAVSSSLVSYTDAAVQAAESNVTAFSSSMVAYVDAADTAFQNNLDNVSSSMITYVDAADSALQQNINDMSSSVSAAISAEATARTNEDLTLLKIDGTRSMSGDLNMGSQNITSAGSASFAGDLTVNGNLTVNGATTAINTTEVQVTDKLITIANGSADAAAANGAGLEVDGAGVSLTYDSASNKWVSDIGLRVADEASFDAAIKLSGSAFTNISTGITGSKYDLNDALHELDSEQGLVATDLLNGYDALRYTTTGSFSGVVGGLLSSTTASAYFDGSGDYISIPSSAAVNGTEDFTVEAWIYRDSAFSQGYDVVMANATGGGFSFTINSNGTLGFGRSLIVTEATTTTGITFNQWNHVAFSRQSGTLRIYVNGQEVYSAANTTSYSVGTVVIGTDGNYSSFPFKGYVDDLRITRGVARYTSAFTAPQQELTLTGDANAASVSVLLNMNGANNSTSFTDSSNNALTITVGGDAKLSTAKAKFGATTTTSAYLDGNGDYLNIPNAYDVITTGSFTLETWIYRNSTADKQAVIGTFNWSGGNNSGWLMQLKSNGQIALAGANGVWNASYGIYNSAGYILTSSLTCSLNDWTHVALTRDGSDTLRIFINGQEAGSTTYAYSLNREGGSGGNIKELKVGSFLVDNSPVTSYGMGNYFSGYIDDLRITQGVARYTGNFVPLTSELSLAGDAHAANVALLLNMSGSNGSTAFTDGSNNAYSITAVGDAMLSDAPTKPFATVSGETDVATITLPAFFTSSMIDYVSVDVMVDQGAGWTNDLVSGKLYTSGSNLKVDINAPAAQSGDKYRLIVVSTANLGYASVNSSGINVNLSKWAQLNASIPMK